MGISETLKSGSGRGWPENVARISLYSDRLHASHLLKFEKEKGVHMYTLNSVVSHLWQVTNHSARDITEFCSVNMDAQYYRISAACDTTEFEFILLLPPLVGSTPLSLPG